MYGMAVGTLGKFAAISPASWLIMLWPEPLNGTCTMSILASAFSSSPDRCGLVPRPAEPNVMLPGRAFASAIELLDGLCGDRRMHRQHIGRQHSQRNRREIAQRIVRQLRVHARIDRQRRQAHQQRVAVGRRLGDDVVADDGAGAGAVIDHHLLAELLGEFLRDDAADDVGAAARRRRHDQPDRAVRVILRLCAGHDGNCREQCECNPGRLHDVLHAYFGKKRCALVISSASPSSAHCASSRCRANHTSGNPAK